eukprot:497657_1
MARKCVTPLKALSICACLLSIIWLSTTIWNTFYINSLMININAEDTVNTYPSNYHYIDSAWYHIFYCQILKHLNHFIITEINLHKDSTYFSFINCNHDYNINILLIQTNKYFNQHSVQNIFNITSYHNILSLRRRIIFSCNTFSIITDCKHIFKHFSRFKQYHSQLKIKHKYIPYLIHFSKCGGKSVKMTLRNLYQRIGKQFVKTINLDCNMQYKKTESHDWTARDDAMYGFGTYNQPVLCDKYLYLMPIREPIERACSQAVQLSSGKTQMLLILQKKNNNTNNITCPSQDIYINGYVYRQISKPSDFKNFFVQILKYDDEYNVSTMRDVNRHRDITTISGHNLKQLLYCNGTSVRMPTMSLFNMLFIPFRYDKYIPSKFIYVLGRKDYFIDRAWTTTKLASYMYTSWLGYNHSFDINIASRKYATFGNYVSRRNIKYEHFINAMNLMFEVDYVLPIQTQTDGNKLFLNKQNEISKIAFNDIKNHYKSVFNIQTEILIHDWQMIHLSSANNLSSLKTCQSITAKDKEMLLKYNHYDIALYNISHIIKHVDEQFYRYT